MARWDGWRSFYEIRGWGVRRDMPVPKILSPITILIREDRLPQLFGGTRSRRHDVPKQGLATSLRLVRGY